MFATIKRISAIPIILLLINLTSFGQTEISGTITTDTTLSSAQSPWVLDGNLYIKGNAVLTIPEGVSIDLNNYKIYIGYSTPGKLIANGATFTTSSSSEKNIFFRDGGQGIVQNCQFNKVYIEIEDDAGDTLQFQSNGFNDVEFQFIAVPHKMPEITGEKSSITQIGLEGNVEDNATLSSNNWNFILTGTIRVQNNATLSITSGVIIDFKNNSLYAGYNTPGKLVADGATLKNSSSSQEIVNFRDGGTGIVSNCQFDNVFIEIEDDAGDTLQFTSNQFQNVSLPIDASPVRLPEIQGDISSVATIGISGYVEESCSLPLKEYTYTLSSNLSIRNNSTLNIEDNVTIDLDGHTFYVGYTTPGRIEAENVAFVSTTSSEKR
ncbi:MAG: hypothetical protein JW798_11140, partial [Prolixibacteraceae bacterium]|nr:hypothetical protein [Prolixibacteraceae bacterium]